MRRPLERHLACVRSERSTLTHAEQRVTRNRRSGYDHGPRA
jgi:hypothetical protein